MPERWKILCAKVPCLCRIFESENKELDIYEVWTPIHDEKSIKLPVWKEVGVTQALALSLSLLAMPCFCAHLLPSLYLMLPFFTSLAAPFLYVLMGKFFLSWERWFLSKAAGILCLFTNILISSLTFCAASMLGRYKLYLCRSGLGLCSFGDRWLWCATKPKVVNRKVISCSPSTCVSKV